MSNILIEACEEREIKIEEGIYISCGDIIYRPTFKTVFVGAHIMKEMSLL